MSEIRQCVEDIRVVSDAAADTDNWNRARLYLRGASHVVFLGFGYNADTINRLRLIDNCSADGRKVFKELRPWHLLAAWPLTIPMGAVLAYKATVQGQDGLGLADERAKRAGDLATRWLGTLTYQAVKDAFTQSATVQGTCFGYSDAEITEHVLRRLVFARSEDFLPNRELDTLGWLRAHPSLIR